MRAQDEAAIVACIPSLRRYARGLVADRDRADDLVQDTLERAWSRFSRWRERGEIRAWMFSIMHNHFVDRLRAQRSRPEHASGDEVPELPQRPLQADALE
ncbi:MAG: sigma-70 family RNA polymerase sigma factor, partial [Pseudomonadota bacterium]|nr:sigma-70 family RNA polymerase sigma factor [Pseudomonadota bacterium]